MNGYLITTVKIFTVLLIITKLLFLIKPRERKGRARKEEWVIIDGEYIVFDEEEVK